MSETASGLPAALWTIESEPFCDAAAVGVKVTVRVQFAPGASELPTLQVLLPARVYCGAEKLNADNTRFAVALPELLIVIDWLKLEPSRAVKASELVEAW